MGKFSLHDLLISFGINPGNNSRKTPLTSADINMREEKVIYQLVCLYPSKIIKQDLRNVDKKLMNEILFLANRKKFKTVNDYLKTIGFEKEIDTGVELRQSKILLTEGDLIRYNFATKEDVCDFELLGQKYNAVSVPVETNLNNYIFMLSNERSDAKRVDYSETMNNTLNIINKK